MMGSKESVQDLSINLSAALREHLTQCESIRGLAILLVFVFHFLGDVYGYQAHPQASLLSALPLGGDTGVTLFFVLSGFLLTLPYFNGASLKLGTYLRNRALRILPMYYAMVLFAGWWTGQWQYVPRALLFQELKLEALFPMGAVWWSLVVEMQFYLLLPCLVVLAQRPALRWVLVVLLALAIYAYWQVSHAPLTANGGWAGQRNTLVGRWPLFCVGALLAWGHVRYGKWLLASQLSARRWPGLMLMLIGIGLLMAIIQHRVTLLGAALSHLLWYDHYLLEALCWGLLLCVLLHLRPLGAILWVNPLLHRLGVWSYSLYLVHASVLFLIGGKLARALGPFRENPLLMVGAGACLFALSCLIASMTYRFVERPFLGLKKRRLVPVAAPVQG